MEDQGEELEREAVECDKKGDRRVSSLSGTDNPHEACGRGIYLT